MVEALFSINLKGELMSATFFKADDILHKDDMVDEYLISRVLKRANNPKKYEWSFSHDKYHIDILNRYDTKVEFFVSLDMAIHLSPKNLVLYSERITFH